MDKSVLISIRPKWCELIANGKKTVEVRKTKPAIKTPFKCYIYCTKPQKKIFYHGEYYADLLYKDFWSDKLVCGCTMDDALNGKVIGEFICNLIAPIAYTTDGFADIVDCETTCMTPQDFLNYGRGNVLYGWRLSDLKIYDEPQELSEFEGLRKTKFGYEPIEIKKPPQSWCFVGRADNALI